MRSCEGRSRSYLASLTSRLSPRLVLPAKGATERHQTDGFESKVENGADTLDWWQGFSTDAPPTHMRPNELYSSQLESSRAN
jgi:hypothetical protein